MHFFCRVVANDTLGQIAHLHLALCDASPQGALDPLALKLAEAQSLATQIAAGPTFAHGVTKKLLHQEWNMGLDEAIEAEAEAQAICMQTRDFRRAYDAFVAKQKPVFEGD